VLLFQKLILKSCMSIPLHFQTTICDNQVFSCQRYQVEILFWTIYSRNCDKMRENNEAVYASENQKSLWNGRVCWYKLSVHVRFVHTNILSVKHNLAWNILMCQSQWPCNLKTWVCGHSFAETLGLNPAGGMDVACECCVLSSRGLCIGLITCPADFYKA